MFREGADVAPELGPAHEKGQRAHRGDRQADDHQTQRLDTHVPDRDDRLREAPGRIAREVRPVPQLHQPDDEDRDREARDHRGERRRTART